MKKIILWLFKTPAGLTVMYLLGSTCASDSKIIFALASIYFFGLWFIEKKIYRALIYSYFPFFLTAIGPTYSEVIIPFYSMLSKELLFNNGVQIYIRFSQLSIVLLCSGFYLITVFFQKKSKILSYIFLLLSIYMLCLFFSSYTTSFQATFSIIQSLEKIGIALWYVLFITGGKRKDIPQETKTMIFILFILIMFEGATAGIQAITSRPIGLVYEQSPFLPNTTDDVQIIKPVGLRGHANNLAIAFMEGFFLFFFYYLYDKTKKIKIITTIAMIITIVVIILSRSRTVYLSMGIGLFYFFLKEKDYFVTFLKKITLFFSKSPFILKGVYITSLCALLYIFFLRMYFSLYTFTHEGSFYGRIQLMDLSIELIKKYPIFGVGTGMFISAANQIPQENFIRSFAAEVHNGFFLLMAENGIFALACFIGLYILYIVYINSVHITKKQKHCIIAGIIGSGISMIFLPYIPILPLSIAFLLKEKNAQS